MGRGPRCSAGAAAPAPSPGAPERGEPGAAAAEAAEARSRSRARAQDAPLDAGREEEGHKPEGAGAMDELERVIECAAPLQRDGAR
jgi:hypothetical protein